MEHTDKELQALIREHHAIGNLLQAALEAHQVLDKKLKAMLENPEPKPKKRRNLKQERIDQYALMVASGTWRKPIELRKTPKKKL